MSNTPVPPRGGKGRNQKGRQARQARQRRNRLYAYGSIGLVVVIVAVFIVVKVAGGGPSNGALRHPAPAADVQKITNVPLTALTSATGISNLVPATNPASPTVKFLGTPPKPELLFIGAEFCPICATERWPMLIALSHFGTFTNLQETHSALDDGDIPTWSFYGATYTSPYLTFTSVEDETNTDKPLQNPTTAENQLWTTFYNGSEEFPFIDFDQQFVLDSEQYPDTTLEGHSFQDILSAVGSNNNTIGNEIDGAAAAFTKYLCMMTGNKPAATCTAVSSISAPVVAQSSGSNPTSNANG